MIVFEIVIFSFSIFIILVNFLIEYIVQLKVTNVEIMYVYFMENLFSVHFTMFSLLFLISMIQNLVLEQLFSSHVHV